jgi:hypothetical protein
MDIDAGAVAEPVEASRVSVRAWEVVREIAIGGVAGLLGGILVVGLGGRLFMRISALVDPAAAGQITSNGEVVGRITLSGTMALVMFAGLYFGVVAGVLWVIASPWIPGRGFVRAAITGLIAACVAAFFVVRAAEPDFRRLEPAAANVAMLLVLAGALGVVVALIDSGLRRRLPPIDPAAPRSPGYAAVTVLGVVMLIAPIQAYFLGFDTAGVDPPIDVGIGLVIVGLATLAWWIVRIARGLAAPPIALIALGRGSLLVATALGATRLATEIADMLRVA